MRGFLWIQALFATCLSRSATLSASVSLPRDVPRGGQHDDPVRAPLGNPDTLADVAQANAGFAGDADHYLGVVRS